MGLLCVLVGCSGSERVAWRGSIDTVSATIRTVNEGGQVWPRGAEWRIEEDLRIGTLEGGPEEFSTIRHFTVDHHGSIYVLMYDAGEVRVFDRDGKFVRTMGRNGRGPGELSRSSSVNVDSAGNIWVADMARFVVFDSTGQYSKTVSRMFPFPERPRDRIVGGRLYDFRTDTPGGPLAFVHIALNADGTFADSLVVRGRPFPPGPLRVIPYTGQTVTHFTPDHAIWIGYSDTYRFVKVTFDHDTMRIIERLNVDRPAVIESDAKRWVLKPELAAEIGVPPIDPRDLPSHKTYWSDFFVSDSGQLWVIPFTSPGGTTTRVVDVFDADGRYLGRARSDFDIPTFDGFAPERGKSLPRMIIRGDYVYANTYDDEGVPYIVRARIVRPSR